ncbi:hypothetical protein Mal4_14850 [Maioricimonas rarisocia]|uniref:Uncharacterized protein n=1 Tax=Maioricimonas rarisocia TaxID=2528026 RepID=A0A517Z3Z2_9PLAN|nr:hypothetical protein [Maioricimonas rarisocia]QDU37176.1 hypothetical protein Mal4_14850 [Maioricimonas rarisocia]
MSTQPGNRLGTPQSTGQADNGWQEQLEEYQHVVTETVRHNPLGATMAAFGAGLGLGIAVSAMLADSHTRRQQFLARSLGQRLLDSVAEYVPDSIGNRFPS